MSNIFLVFRDSADSHNFYFQFFQSNCSRFTQISKLSRFRCKSIKLSSTRTKCRRIHHSHRLINRFALLSCESRTLGKLFAKFSNFSDRKINYCRRFLSETTVHVFTFPCMWHKAHKPEETAWKRGKMLINKRHETFCCHWSSPTTTATTTSTTNLQNVAE